jgi:hypothetical protein
MSENIYHVERIPMTAAQVGVVCHLSESRYEVTIQSGSHGYIEVDVFAEDRTRIYEIAPDGRVSRAA